MIPVSLENIFEIFVIVLLVAIAVIWIHHLWQQNPHRSPISKESLCRCQKCSLTYIVGRFENKVTRCPRCQELNTVDTKLKI